MRCGNDLRLKAKRFRHAISRHPKPLPPTTERRLRSGGPSSKQPTSRVNDPSHLAIKQPVSNRGSHMKRVAPKPLTISPRRIRHFFPHSLTERRTPLDATFEISAMGVPTVAVSDWRLDIAGLLDVPTTL